MDVVFHEIKLFYYTNSSIQGEKHNEVINLYVQTFLPLHEKYINAQGEDSHILETK